MAMEIDMQDEAAEAHGEHPPTTIRQYLLLGAVLTVVTIIELWTSYNAHILKQALVPILVVLSAFKFGAVVAVFMHLRYEKPLLTRLFLFGLILATCILLALIALFWGDVTDAVGSATRAAAGGAAR